MYYVVTGTLRHNVHNVTPTLLIIVEKAQFIGIVR